MIKFQVNLNINNSQNVISWLLCHWALESDPAQNLLWKFWIRAKFCCESSGSGPKFVVKILDPAQNLLRKFWIRIMRGSRNPDFIIFMYSTGTWYVQVYNLSELANWRSHYGIGEFIENMKNKAQLTHLSDIK